MWPRGGTTTNDLTAGTQLDGIQFLAGAGNFVLNGNGIALQGDVVNNSSSAQQINLPIQLTSGIAWNFNTAAGDLALGGAVSGSGSLNKLGAGTLTVLSNLTFNGSVNVAAGTLQVGNGGSSGSFGSVPTSLSAGASLIFNRSDTYQVGNVISGAGNLIKRGSGTMQFSGTLSNTGPTIIEAGTLQIASQAGADAEASLELQRKFERFRRREQRGGGGCRREQHDAFIVQHHAHRRFPRCVGLRFARQRFVAERRFACDD